jgi:hypothetical protein
VLAYKDSGSDSNNDSDKKSLIFLIDKKVSEIALSRHFDQKKVKKKGALGP